MASAVAADAAVPVEALTSFWLFKWWGDVPEGWSVKDNFLAGTKLAGAVHVVNDAIVYEWDGEGDVPEQVATAAVTYEQELVDAGTV